MKHIKVPPKGSPLFNLNDGRVGCNRGSSNGGLGVQLPVLHAEPSAKFRVRKAGL